MTWTISTCPQKDGWPIRQSDSKVSAQLCTQTGRPAKRWTDISKLTDWSGQNVRSYYMCTFGCYKQHDKHDKRFIHRGGGYKSHSFREKFINGSYTVSLAIDSWSIKNFRRIKPYCLSVYILGRKNRTLHLYSLIECLWYSFNTDVSLTWASR